MKPRFDDVRQAANGHWVEILSALGVDAGYLRRKHGACPACGGVDRFRFDDRDGRGTFYCSSVGAGDGFALLSHVYSWPASEALERVAHVLGMTRGDYSPPIALPKPRAAPTPSIDPSQALERLKRTWTQCLGLDHASAEPARSYLASRGLSALIERGDCPAWRYRPALPYWIAGQGEKPLRLGDYPALVGVVRDVRGYPVALHRTWLTPEGRKLSPADPHTGEVHPARKLTSPIPGTSVSGGAVRLYAASDTLAVAEGLETALSARVGLPELPVWACVSANGMKALQLPPTVRQLVIIADHDAAGLDAAGVLAERVRACGVEVVLIAPSAVGDDLNDSLQ